MDPMLVDRQVDPNSEEVRVLAAPLFKQGAERVFVHECCGWVVVAEVRQAQCRECRLPITEVHVVGRPEIS